MEITSTATAPSISPALRWYLYFTAAVTGSAIMVVEILGAKMLAPYVGTSHFVWTAQIAVTLVSLALGYYVGGWLVDRSPRAGLMYAAILTASVYLCLTVRIVEPVAYWGLQYKLATGSLMASAVLYFVPLALLAMTGPFFIRLLTVAVSGVGGNVGRLSAVSTVGSVIGTVLIGYVLIPFLRNSITMYLTAAALMAVVLVYFLCWGRKPALAIVAVFIAAGLALGMIGVRHDGQANFHKFKQLYRANSNFGQLQVVEADNSDRRVYLNDFLCQNTFDPDTKESTSMFSYMLYGLAECYVPHVQDALCIGMGVGVAPMKLAIDGAKVDVVEINPAVVPIAKQYFDFDPSKVNVIIGDGRQFVNATDRKYDAIVLDAFLGDSTPSHLMSREAFAGMHRLLRPGGVLVINTFCEFTQGDDFFSGSLDKTLKSVFATVRIHSADGGNVFFVASDNRNLLLLREIDYEKVHPTCRFEVRDAFAGITQANPDAGIVLTDDYNPVEYRDAANRERYRHSMAMQMKELEGG